MISIISACYGEYDTPWPAPEHADLHTVFVSGNLETLKAAADNGWVTCVHHPQPNMHPRLAAKVPKCRPDRFAFDSPATRDEATVWLDAGGLVVNANAFVDAVRIASVRVGEREQGLAASARTPPARADRVTVLPQTGRQQAQGRTGHVGTRRVDKHAKPLMETVLLVENPSTRGFSTLSA